MKFTAVFAVVLSMATFAIAAPVAAPAKGTSPVIETMQIAISNRMTEVVRADHGACVKSEGDGVMETVNC